MLGSSSGSQLAYRNVQGDVIFVDVRLDPSLCNKRALEVCVSGGRIQFVPWLGYTSILAMMAFITQMHTIHLAWLLLAVLMQLATFVYRVRGKIVSESLLVVAGLGVQTTATFYTGKQHTRFIPWGDVIDIIIAETISMQRVLFYMALLVKRDKAVPTPKLIPLFLNTWPRLACLQHIYRACQEVLSPDFKVNMNAALKAPGQLLRSGSSLLHNFQSFKLEKLGVT
ncbi:phosphatidylinositol N-acetylglucosaminyltransferase subunit H-like isoform X2 [Homarus americanus]|uniref:phosphatidylinositol N-acetylglucosaminyltransferase subunit H-like isoform X2 n=1 Tax=Homarus americanus TaxID=6706 RepID=UPI001C436FBB|nr:phosphatidylinositol N-acetylglucosaminyltransferase subunit H-like isoform X2 [Homarus americanus]